MNPGVTKVFCFCLDYAHSPGDSSDLNQLTAKHCSLAVKSQGMSMQKKKNNSRTGLVMTAIASAVLLAACGGGGGGGGGAAPAGVAIGGGAAKGPLKNADVTIFCGSTDTVIGTATTNNLGRYTAENVAACNDPLRIIVSSKADGSTTMENELGGPDIAIPAGFVMRAYLPERPSSGTISDAFVTPFSDMAARLIEANDGAITRDRVVTSRAAIERLLDVELTSDPTTGTKKGLLTAIMELAQGNLEDPESEELGKDAIEQAIDDLFALLDSDLSENDDGSIQVDSTRFIGKLNEKLPEDKQIPPLSEEKLIVIAPTTVQKIEQTKAFLQTLKADLLTLWNDDGTGFLNQKDQEIAAALDAVQSTTRNLDDYIDILEWAAGFVIDYREDTLDERGYGEGSDDWGHYLQRGDQIGTNCIIYTEPEKNGFRYAAGEARCFWPVARDAMGNVTQREYLFVIVDAEDYSNFSWKNELRDQVAPGRPYSIREGTVTGWETDETRVLGKLQPVVAGASDTSVDWFYSAEENEDGVETVSMHGTIQSGHVSIQVKEGSNGSESWGEHDEKVHVLDLSFVATVGSFSLDGVLKADVAQGGRHLVDDSEYLVVELASASEERSLMEVSPMEWDQGGFDDYYDMPVKGDLSFTGKIIESGRTFFDGTFKVEDYDKAAGIEFGNFSISADIMPAAGSKYEVRYNMKRPGEGECYESGSLRYTNPAGTTVNATMCDDESRITSGAITVENEEDGKRAIRHSGVNIGSLSGVRATFIDGSYVIVW